MYLHMSCFVSSLHCPSPLILSLHCHCMNYMSPTHVHYITSVSFLVSLGVSAGWGQEPDNDWWPNVSLFSLHQGPRLAPVWSVNLARSRYQDITVTAHQMYLLSTVFTGPNGATPGQCCRLHIVQPFYFISIWGFLIQYLKAIELFSSWRY